MSGKVSEPVKPLELVHHWSSARARAVRIRLFPVEAASREDRLTSTARLHGRLRSTARLFRDLLRSAAQILKIHIATITRLADVV